MARFRSLALLLFCVVFSLATAHGQASLYAVAGIANYGFTHLTPGDIKYKGDTGSLGGGGFYNFPIHSRVTVGLDGRALYSPGDKGGFNAGAALRVGFVPHSNPLRPYFQVGGGIVHSFYDDLFYNYDQTGTPSIVTTRRTVNSGAAEFTVGLDIRLSDRVDLRIPEWGALAGGGSGVAAGVGFANAGIVYHLRP
jgi:hypothetical protein